MQGRSLLLERTKQELGEGGVLLRTCLALSGVDVSGGQYHHCEWWKLLVLNFHVVVFCVVWE